MIGSISDSVLTLPSPELNCKSIIESLSKLLELDNITKNDSLEAIDGWAYGSFNYKFDDLVVLSLIQILCKVKSADSFLLRIPEL